MAVTSRRHAAGAFSLLRFGMAIGGGGYWLNYPQGVKRRVLNYIRAQVASDEPEPFAVELRDDCVWTKQGRTQLSFEWSNVAEILDSEDAIEFVMHDGGFVVVRNKGFATGQARREFKQIADEMLQRTLKDPEAESPD